MADSETPRVQNPATSQTTATAPPGRITIQDASAWVLRIGVLLSAVVMLIGTALSFYHGNAGVIRLEESRFEYRPSVIFDGVAHGQGKAVVEVGIYLLVLTPILRVFTSIILFVFEEHDWLYALLTFLVLILTLAGLLFVH